MIGITEENMYIYNVETFCQHIAFSSQTLRFYQHVQ